MFPSAHAMTFPVQLHNHSIPILGLAFYVPEALFVFPASSLL
jgi:hypothetical protein